MQDSIVQCINLEAPVARVWRAITDHQEFGTWFGARLDAPFENGAISHGRMTYPGYEHFRWYATVTALDPQRYFAFTWCPFSDNPDADYALEPTTLVEFRLEPAASGCTLTITESGFSRLPDDDRRMKALRMNTEGWAEQAVNIAEHVQS